MARDQAPRTSTKRSPGVVVHVSRALGQAVGCRVPKWIGTTCRAPQAAAASAASVGPMCPGDRRGPHRRPAAGRGRSRPRRSAAGRPSPGTAIVAGEPHRHARASDQHPHSSVGAVGHRPGHVVGTHEVNGDAVGDVVPGVGLQVRRHEAVRAGPDGVLRIGENGGVPEASQRGEVGVVVVQVREQHRVDIGDVRVHREVGAAAEDSESASQHRVGDDADAGEVEDDRGVAEPGGADALATDVVLRAHAPSLDAAISRRRGWQLVTGPRNGAEPGNLRESGTVGRDCRYGSDQERPRGAAWSRPVEPKETPMASFTPSDADAALFGNRSPRRRSRAGSSPTRG